MTKKSSGSIEIHFRHHLETSVDDKKNGGEMLSRELNKLIIISSLSSFIDKNPVKVSISAIGKVNLI